MHDATHETLLESLLAGDLDPASPQVRAQLSACAECRSSWAEMQQITRSLDELANPASAVLTEAADLRHTPGERQAERRLREEIAQARAGSGLSQALRRPRLLLLAATVLLAVGAALILWRAQQPPARPDPYLSGETRFELSPRGPCDELFPIRWKHQLARSEHASLRIETRDDASGAWQLLYDGPFRGPDASWSPTDAERNRCGKSIRYRVAFEQEHARLSSDWVEASLR